MVFQQHQNLGALRGDITLGRTKREFPFVWLLSQDSKSTAFTRLLFAMRPWYASEPVQLDGAQGSDRRRPGGCLACLGIAASARAPDLTPDRPPAAPLWVRGHAPWLRRFWGDGLEKARNLAINHTILEWSRSDPDGLLAALAYRRPQTARRGSRMPSG